MDTLLNWDANALLWIQENIRNEFLNGILTFYTTLGNGGMLWIAFSLLCLALPKYRRVGLTCALSMILTLFVVNLGLKNIVARVRPYDAIEGLTRLVPEPSGFSFPSGHSAHAFAVAVVLLVMLKKKVGIPIFILAGLMALSRLYVGVHYPTDVIIGSLAGTLMAICSMLLMSRFQKISLDKTNTDERVNYET